MSLWVPPKVAAKLVEERREFIGDVERQITRDALQRWERELARVDERLSLVLAHPRAHGTPLVPGYWHILRDNPGAPPSIMPLQGPDGERLEPGPHMFDMLAKSDLWNPRIMQHIRGARRRAEEAADRERAELRREREEAAREMVNAATRTQVSMNSSVPWTQNASAAARRDRDSRKAT